MTNELNQEKASYRYPAEETPYQRASQTWDERMGSARVQARHWRWIALMALVGIVLLAVCLLWEMTHNKNMVYVAEVKSGGDVVNVARLQTPYQPSVAQYQYFIGYFIRLTMSLPLDPVVVKQNWLNAYQFVQGKGQQQLSQLAQHLKPFALIGQETQTVVVTSVQQITPKSYTARWVQTQYDAQGKVSAKRQYTGVFTVSHRQPTSQDAIMTNPLGIYIDYFTVTEH